MTGFIEDAFLRSQGLTDADIANLNGVLGDIANLVNVAKNHQAQLNKVMTVILPIAQKIIAKQRELK